MPVGHPDSADVRRHFFGRTIMQQSGALGASGFVGFSIPEASIDDVAVIRLFTDQQVCTHVDSFGVAGDIAESFQFGLNIGWGSGRRFVVQPMGGGLDVLIQDTSAIAGKAYNFQVDTYVGADANQLAVHHEQQSLNSVAVANTASTTPLPFPTAPYFDYIAVMVSAAVAGVAGQVTYTGNASSGTAGTMQSQVQTWGTTAAGTPTITALLPTLDKGMHIEAVNLSGGAATIFVAARAFRVA